MELAENPLMKMVLGYWDSQIVATAARLGLADRLAKEPRDAAELARDVGADEDALWRLLRACTVLGLMDETESGRFALTETGQALRSGALRDIAVGMAGPGLYRAFEGLHDSVVSGHPAGPQALGMGVYEYYGTHPEERVSFTTALSGFAASVTAAVPDLVDVSSRTRIVDIGGGDGAFLAALLKRAPGATGVLLDRPGATIVDADRIEVVGGNFHEAVPTGGDLYVVMRVLHNWDDTTAARILRNCRDAGGPDSRLLVVEQLRADDPSMIDLLDLVMLVHFGGRVRSRGEYDALLTGAGYRIERVTEVADAFAPFSVIEAVTAGF